MLLNVAYSERERAVESALVGKRLRYTRLFLAPEAVENVRRVRGLAAEGSFRPFRPRYHVEPFQRPREELLAAIERIRPDVLMGSGSVLEVFFRLAAARGAPRHLPRVVLYGWDPMTAYGRELIEQTFGIPVLSRYSAMECLKIGFFCELRRGFHLHEDLCHVEARGPDGLPVAAGESGELVLSNLFNRGTVLLNYRLGDRGALSDAPCPCGRGTRVLVELDGRVDDAIALPDGGIVGAMGDLGRRRRSARDPAASGSCSVEPRSSTSSCHCSRMRTSSRRPSKRSPRCAQRSAAARFGPYTDRTSPSQRAGSTGSVVPLRSAE